MIQKICSSVTEALQDIADGSTILISGFGGAGLPIYLLDALLEQGAKELTLVSNNAGNQGIGIAKLIGACLKVYSQPMTASAPAHLPE